MSLMGDARGRATGGADCRCRWQRHQSSLTSPSLANLMWCRTGCPCTGAFHDRIKRHPSRDDRRSCGRSERGRGRFIRHAHRRRACSIRERRLFWFPAPSAGLGIGVTLHACSKNNATRFIRLHEIRALSGAPYRRNLERNRNRRHREATLDRCDRQ